MIWRVLNGRNRCQTRSAPRLPVRWGPSPTPHPSHGWSAYPRATMHGMISHYSKLTVHSCFEVGRQSYASLGGVGSSQSMVPPGGQSTSSEGLSLPTTAHQCTCEIMSLIVAYYIRGHEEDEINVPMTLSVFRDKGSGRWSM